MVGSPRAVGPVGPAISQVDPATVAAYQRAHYRVEDAFVLNVDRPSEPLAAWHAAHGVDCSALVTACNPCGRCLHERQNQQATQDLADWIEQSRIPGSPTIGLDPDGRWPAEPGFLLAGLALEAAQALGRTFQQNAIIWSGADAVPRLILLR